VIGKFDGRAAEWDGERRRERRREREGGREGGYQ